MNSGDELLFKVPLTLAAGETARVVTTVEADGTQRTFAYAVPPRWPYNTTYGLSLREPVSASADHARRRNVWRWRRWVACRLLLLVFGFAAASLFWAMLLYTLFTPQP